MNQIYEKIKNDNEIINAYKKVEEYEKNEKCWAYHNLEHIKNVTNIVEKILQELKIDENLIIKAKIACILHDVGASQGKENHAERSYMFAKKYFKKNKINFDDINLVLDAIKIHSDGFDTDNIIALALIFADKLDVKKTRISEEGETIEGNRQFSHINDIEINIKAQELKINFITDKKMDINELNNYYFTKKIFKAVEFFSKKINLNYEILLDNNVWKI